MSAHAASTSATDRGEVAAPPDEARARSTAPLRWVPVLSAWVVSRIVTIVGLAVVGGKPLGRIDLDALADWDTGWFEAILRSGYQPSKLPLPWAVGPEHWTTWPFFPLSPWLAEIPHAVGVSGRASLILVNNLAFLAALAGLYKVAARHLGSRGGVLAVWAMALFPGSVTSAMGYSGGLFVAGMVWAFWFVGQRRWLASGLAVAVAVAARPNGFLLLAPLGLAVLVLCRQERRPWLRPALAAGGPSVAFLVAWALYCRHRTGDALVFLHAKAAWEEVPLGQFLRHPLAGNSTVHVFICAIAVALVALAWKRLPVSWHLLVAVMVVPSLVLGMIGLARYAGEAFPVSVAAAALLERLPRWTRPVYFVASGLGLVIFAAMVNRWRYVP